MFDSVIGAFNSHVKPIWTHPAQNKGKIAGLITGTLFTVAYIRSPAEVGELVKKAVAAVTAIVPLAYMATLIPTGIVTTLTHAFKPYHFQGLFDAHFASVGKLWALWANCFGVDLSNLAAKL